MFNCKQNLNNGINWNIKVKQPFYNNTNNIDNKKIINKKIINKKIINKKMICKKINNKRNKIKDDFYKTELCQTFEQYNECKYGDNCQFAHGEGELRTRIETLPSSYKRVKCKKFWNGFICPYGNKCKFAHDEVSLDNIQFEKDKKDPKFRTKECDTFNKTGNCPYGNRCKFIHKIKRQNSDEDFINNSRLFKWVNA